MKRVAPSTRVFLVACSVVMAAAVAWRVLAPKSAQGPAPLAAQVIPEGPPCVVPFPRNIIVFETDDQRWDSLFRDIDPLTSGDQYAMPHVREFFIDNGVYFENAFVTNPTCCPSRASQLSGGFYSHNTGVLTNTWPNGGALRFEDEDALAVRMKGKCYYNVLIGKYMNGYEDLKATANSERGRYVPPAWDLFIVPSDSRDWDRDYKITVGSNGDDENPVDGFIFPDDVCLQRNEMSGECEKSNWEPLDGGTLEADLVAMGVPQSVVNVLKTEFEFAVLESGRDWTYLPELEYLLAQALLENLDVSQKPLFALFTMAPPHGPTQLDSQFLDCDNDDEPTGNFTQSGRAYGEQDVSDKPSWMRGNYDVFLDYQSDPCNKSLLHCYRGVNCNGEDCSGDDGNCDRDVNPNNDRNYRSLQQVFRDELGSLLIIDNFIGGTNGLLSDGPTNTVYFFTSDHGSMWGEHGSFQKGIPYEEAIRVPFAVAGEDIRAEVTVEDMIAFDLDMPATILEIAGYSRNKISKPGETNGIESDGCSLLGILEGTTWGDCYTDAPSGLLPREQILIQSMRNLAPNATPTFAGLRYEDRKFVLTDTLEEEYYSFATNDFEEDNLMHSDPPADVGELRNELTGGMGLAIVPDPRTADWNLPIAIPGQGYEVQFSTISGNGSTTWCLWDFHDDPDPCVSCSGDLNDLGCLVKDFEANGDKDCDCYQPSDPDDACTCDCGLLEWMTWDEQTATLSCTSVPSNLTAKCYQFVVAAKDGSVSPYDGRSQRVLRIFRIAIGDGLEVGSQFDTYVSENSENQDTTYCDEEKLLVSGTQGGREVSLIRFVRTAGDFDDRAVLGGEVILHAASDLTDATLHYLQRQSDEDCPVFLLDPLDTQKTCEVDLYWTTWAGLQDVTLVPIMTVWDIKQDNLVRFDVSDSLKLPRYQCAWNSHPYEFVITSTDTTAEERGFYSTEGTGRGPRLAFTYEADLDHNSEGNDTRCGDCKDNDCDGDVDCDDAGCCDRPGCDPCDP